VATIMALEGVSKSYGGIDALKDVSLELRSGEICAILGSNGAGKSTLIKCLTGAITPDGGHVVVDGATVTFVHPSQALAAGVRVVYQELSLFPALSVTENLLGPTVLGRWIRWRRAHVTASNDLQGFGVSIDPRGRVEDLSLGEQQIVEIVRAVRSGGRIVILDEPTSSLGPAQSEALFEFLHTLAATGVAVLFVTQHFNDALEHADWISVMREGRLSEPQAKDESSVTDLLDLVFGEENDVLESTYEVGSVRLRKLAQSDQVLQVDGIRCSPLVHDMSLTAHAGEVVGLYGKPDSGHVNFAEAIFGFRHRQSGSVVVDGVPVRANSPMAAKRAGIGFVAADRREALALTHPVVENVTLANLSKMSKWLLSAGEEEKVTQRAIKQLSIKNAKPEMPVESLSGGNQQKVLFARWLLVEPRVLVLVEPTRGMDLAAKSEVLRIIKERASAGSAIVVISSEPEMILSVADRVLIASRGSIVGQLADEEVSVASLIALAS